MGSSSLKSREPSSENLIYDPIRKKWVEKSPEELIRQHLVQQMVQKLGYPSALIAIEKELSQFPHVLQHPHASIPKRRADIVAFTRCREEGRLTPLLLIECKALPLTPHFAGQVIGYNAFIKAPFISLANGKEILTGYYDQEKYSYCFDKGLPSFSALLERLICQSGF